MLFGGSDKKRATHHEKEAERFYDKGNYEQALKHTDLALKHGTKAYNGNPGYLSVKQFHRAILLRDMGRHDEALQAFDLALDLARKSDESTGLQAVMLFNAGVIHGTLGRYSKAIELYLQAEPLYFSDPKDMSAQIGNLQYALADAYRHTNQLDKALDRASLAEAAYVKAWGEDNAGLARCYWIAGDVHKARGEMNEARGRYQQAFLNCVQHLEPGHKDIAEAARLLTEVGGDPITVVRENFGEAIAAQLANIS